MNVNHLLAWRQLINTGHRHTEFPHEGPTLSMAIWKQIEKQTDMYPSSKKTNASSQMWNREKPRETKPSLHPVNSPMFFLLYFSPHTLFCFDTYWKTLLVYDFTMEEAWHKRPIEEIGMPKIEIKETLGFPGGAVVENLPANAGDTGSSPGLGRSHMPRGN